MPLRRNHLHAQQRGDGVNNLEKRVRTVYMTVTSTGYTGEATTIGVTNTKDSDDKTSSSETELHLQTASSSSSLPSAIDAATASEGSVASTLAIETESSSASRTSQASIKTASAASSSAAAASSSAASSSDNSSSSDTATKAGIALGILGGLFVVLALVYWAISRKRKQMKEQRRVDDEKLSPFQDPPPPRTPAKAPRLSLRPMTQLFTTFNTSSQPERQANNASAIAMTASPTTRRAPGGSAWERPMTNDSQSERNPFGPHAEQIVDNDFPAPRNIAGPLTPISEASMQVPSPDRSAGLSPAPRVSAHTTDSNESARHVSAITTDSATIPAIVTNNGYESTSHSSPQMSPIEPADQVVGQALSSPGLTATAAPVTAGAAVVVSSQRRQSVRKENVPAPLDLTLPPKLPAVPGSPAMTEFSLHEVDSEQSPAPSQSAAAIAAAGGPANSTVHRVQLDFNPTLDDELGLQAGQLVRLLHEYDDGWALCIRLDRSKQGVVPRTCLSTRPVKPRPPPQGGPRGPPINPQGRPRGPSVSSQRGPGPNMPPVARPMGPHGGQRGPGYTSLSGSPMVAGPRPETPSGQQSQSPSGTGRMNSPQGPSNNRQQEHRPEAPLQGPVTRKPVPGQAY